MDRRERLAIMSEGAIRQDDPRAAEQARRLADAHRELAESCRNEVEFARRWSGIAEVWSFHAVNELIEKHNRNFPAESRLPMDPRTGDFVRLNGKPYRLEPLDSAWILERFPNDLEALRVDVDDDG